jgi:hypothetical protein
VPPVAAVRRRQRLCFGSGMSEACLPYVVEFLDKKKLDCPPALRSSAQASARGGPSARTARTPADVAPVETLAEFKWALGLLCSLRERERKSLARYVQKRRVAAACPPPAAPPGSEGEEEGAAVGSAELGPPQVRGGTWPSGVAYSNDYVWGKDVPAALRAAYRPETARPRPARPCPRAYAARITDEAHPACGQHGLFAAAPLAHGAWVLDYVGAICLGENEDRSSDYVCDFGEHSELALDANAVGNEGRFVNDYRNTGRRPSVEFRLRRDRAGELRQVGGARLWLARCPGEAHLRTAGTLTDDGGHSSRGQGIFICAKGGVARDEELLISYGKSYWSSRVGSLDEFITRRPGEGPAAPASTPARDAE